MIDYIALQQLSNGKKISLFGHYVYLCDKTGIEASSATELFRKINWCKEVGIYSKGFPINCFTVYELLTVNI